MIEPGDFVPNIRLLDATGVAYPINAPGFAGFTRAIIFMDAVSLPALRAQLTDLGRHISDICGANALPIIVVNLPSPSSDAEASDFKARRLVVLFDPDGTFPGLAGVAPLTGQMVSVVINRNGRLLATVSALDPSATVLRIAEICRGETARRDESPLATQAPALLIPRIFEPADCRAFIAHWEGGEKLVNEVFDGEKKISIAERKRRTDVFVPKGDHPLNRLLAKRVTERIIPETAKAFQFTPHFYDVARIGRYDAADRGFFGPHRDIRNENREYPRKFALTLNLNDGFVGGGLRFPEYGDHVYTPPAGGGVVFSVALLHEALPVEEGQRFGLFLFFN